MLDHFLKKEEGLKFHRSKLLLSQSHAHSVTLNKIPLIPFLMKNLLIRYSVAILQQTYIQLILLLLLLWQTQYHCCSRAVAASSRWYPPLTEIKWLRKSATQHLHGQLLSTTTTTTVEQLLRKILSKFLRHDSEYIVSFLAFHMFYVLSFLKSGSSHVSIDTSSYSSLFSLC